MAKRDELEGQGGDDDMMMMHCMMPLIVKVQTERFFMLQRFVKQNILFLSCHYAMLMLRVGLHTKITMKKN